MSESVSISVEEIKNTIIVEVEEDNSVVTLETYFVNENVYVEVFEGIRGEKGQEGLSHSESFETASKNLRAYDYSFVFTNSVLTSIIYDLGDGGIVTKSFEYESGLLKKIILSGDTVYGIKLTKELNYSLSGDLSNITYI